MLRSNHPKPKNVTRVVNRRKLFQPGTLDTLNRPHRARVIYCPECGLARLNINDCPHCGAAPAEVNDNE